MQKFGSLNAYWLISFQAQKTKKNVFGQWGKITQIANSLHHRFANSLSEKEAEIKRMFQDLEEATKLSTFWEKECNDLKASNARQVLRTLAFYTFSDIM